MTDTDSLRLEIDVDVKGQTGLNAFANSLENIRGLLTSIQPMIKRLSSSMNSINNNSAITNPIASVGSITSPLPPTAVAELETFNTASESVAASVEEVGEASEQASEHIKEVAKQTNKASESAKKGQNAFTKLAHAFGRIILYRAIRNIIKGITEGLTEGVQNLARYSSSFNDTMSDFVSSTSQLKNAFGTLAEPILTAVLPVIEWLIQKIIFCINEINEMVAIVKGDKSFTAATYVQIDYAESLDKTNKSAKALQKTLMGFDEINRLSDNASKSASSNSGVDASKMFEERNVNASPFETSLGMTINDVLFDWTDLNGEQIAEKIVTGLTMLTGGAIGFYLGGPGGAIIGAIAGLGISLLMNSLLFDHNGKIDGTEIASMILSGLGLVSGAVIGAITIGGLTGGAIGATIGLVVGFGLSLANKKIIESDISTEQIQQFFDDVCYMLIGLLAGLGVTAVTGNAGFGMMMGVTVSAILKDFEPFKALREGWNNGYTEALEEGKSKFEAIWEGIIEAVKNLLGIHSPSTVMHDIGKNFVEGFYNGIHEKWEDVKAWFDEKKLAFETFKNDLTSKVSNASANLKSTIGSALDNIATKFDNAKTKISNVYNSLKSGTKDFVNNGIISPLERMINSILSGLRWLLSKAQTIINAFPDSVRSKLGLDKIANATVSDVSLPRFANGGFPEDGIFMANSSELVGQFANGRTAVANNQQITDGIEEAAYRGFARAMSESGNGNGNYTFVAQLNGKTLFEEVIKQNNSSMKTLGVSPLGAF